MMQRVLELREIKAGEAKVPLANGDGLVPLSVPTKAKAVEAPAPKTPDNAEAETTIEVAAKKQ